MLQNLLTGFLGVAVVIVAFLDLSSSTLMWTLGILGTVIAIFGFWGSISMSEITPKDA